MPNVSTKLSCTYILTASRLLHFSTKIFYLTQIISLQVANTIFIVRLPLISQLAVYCMIILCVIVEAAVSTPV